MKMTASKAGHMSAPDDAPKAAPKLPLAQGAVTHVATEPELVRFHKRSILILVQKIQSRLKGFQCMSELQPQQELQLSPRLHWSTSRTGGHYVSAGVGVADIYELGIHWESTAGGESRTQFLILWETLRAFMKKIVDASMPNTHPDILGPDQTHNRHPNR
jgi:hypothetical protein